MAGVKTLKNVNKLNVLEVEFDDVVANTAAIIPVEPSDANSPSAGLNNVEIDPSDIEFPKEARIMQVVVTMDSGSTDTDIWLRDGTFNDGSTDSIVFRIDEVSSAEDPQTFVVGQGNGAHYNAEPGFVDVQGEVFQFVISENSGTDAQSLRIRMYWSNLETVPEFEN